MAITAEQQNSRLEGPKPPKGKIVLQAPPELEPSDGVNTLLTSLVPLLGTQRHGHDADDQFGTHRHAYRRHVHGVVIGIRGGQRLPPTFATHGEPRGGKT